MVRIRIINKLERAFGRIGLNGVGIRSGTWLFGSRVLGRSPKAGFIIFCLGRSGSNLLSDLLDQHPDVFCDGEVFGYLSKVRLSDPKRFLRQRSRITGNEMYGCKVKVYDLTGSQGMLVPHARDLIVELCQQGWKIIHLRRHDIFRQALSSLVAEHRNVYHHVKGKDGSVEPMTLDADSMTWRLKQLLAYADQEDYVLRGLDHIRLDYEQDLMQGERHQATLDRVLDHLGLNRIEARTKFVRTSSDDPSTYIANYVEFVSVLREAGLEQYLPDTTRQGPTEHAMSMSEMDPVTAAEKEKLDVPDASSNGSDHDREVSRSSNTRPVHQLESQD